MEISEYWYIDNICIPDEREKINFYAQEIVEFKRLLELPLSKDNDKIRQWNQYFLTYSEIALEAANGRLEENRRQLTDNYQQ